MKRVIQSIDGTKALVCGADFKHTVYLNIGGKEFSGSDPYLSISTRYKTGNGYHVNGVVGFGGMGYRGHLSTQCLIKGLQRMGFNVTARSLRALFISR